MERRRFTREFKLEAVRLIRERGVSYVAGVARSGRASVGAAQLGEGASRPIRSMRFPATGR